ncbi:hypothetical protein ACFFRR_004064 [Megaselia abdita]
MVQAFPSILTFMAIVSSMMNYVLTEEVCTGCPNNQYSEINAYNELEFLLPALNVDDSEASKDKTVLAYKNIISGMFCENSTSSCESTSEDYLENFIELMKKEFISMGLSEEQITSELLNSIKTFYDNIAVHTICATDCSSVSNTYENWVEEMGELLKYLFSGVTDETNEAAINVIQARVTMHKCTLGCTGF